MFAVAERRFDGYNFAAAEIAATSECIDFDGLSRTQEIDVLPPPRSRSAGGWRRNDTEASEAWLAFSFEALKLN